MRAPGVVVCGGGDEGVAVWINEQQVRTRSGTNDGINEGGMDGMKMIVLCINEGTDLRETEKHIPNFRLPSQLRLGQYTHINEITSPLPIHQALRSRRELRTFHADDGFARVKFDVATFRL